MEEKDVRIGSLMQLFGMFTLGACGNNPVAFMDKCGGLDMFLQWSMELDLNTDSILASVARKWNLGTDMLLFIPQPLTNVIAV